MARPLPLTDTPLIRAVRPTSLQLVMARTHLLLQARRIADLDADDEFAAAYDAVAAYLEAIAS